MAMLEIRLMDDSYILDRCSHTVPFKPDGSRPDFWCYALGTKKEGWYEVHANLMERYGNCAAMAWERGRVVGFITFYPKRYAMFTDMYGGPKDAMYFDQSLIVGCLMVVDDDLFKGKSIGKHLAEKMVEWAWDNNYRRIEVHNVTSGLLDFFWAHDQKSTVQFWQDVGFRILYESGEHEIEDIMNWFMDTGARAGIEKQVKMALSDGKTEDEIFRLYSMVLEREIGSDLLPKGVPGNDSATEKE
jgi:GNAT superfamily N-acetyltransferase